MAVLSHFYSGFTIHNRHYATMKTNARIVPMAVLLWLQGVFSIFCFVYNFHLARIVPSLLSTILGDIKEWQESAIYRRKYLWTE
jgi:hypothetical protein